MQLVSGAPTGVKQYAIKGSDQKENRISRDKPTAVKWPEGKLQEDSPPYRETTVAKSANTTDESGSDNGSGKGNGQKALARPGDAVQPQPGQPLNEDERLRLRRDIERSLK